MTGADLVVETGGEGPDLLVMLHGMGATAAVWSPLCAHASQRWAGRWMTLDLPGHGGSGPAAGYAIGLSAAAVARAVLPRVDSAGDVVVVGHSLGGVIALALATGWFGVVPHRVFGAGIKVAWSDDEVQRMAALAAQPVKHLATEDEARHRYLKVSGLAGLADAASPLIERGVRRDAEGWRLAMDPRAFAVGRPAIAQWMGLARCPVRLGRGAHDPMVSTQQIRAFGPDAVELGPHGHNVMVEAPMRVWDWIAAG